jgi:hypothetical protein
MEDGLVVRGYVDWSLFCFWVYIFLSHILSYVCVLLKRNISEVGDARDITRSLVSDAQI